MAKRAFHDIAETPVPDALENETIDLALFPESGDDGFAIQGWMTKRFMGRTAQIFTTDARFVAEGQTLACVTHLCHGWRKAEPAHG